jgi:hypothetical protein
MNFLKEDGCSALNSELLTDASVSTMQQYLSTLRIKKWNPKNTSLKANSNSQYCYIDNDASNGMIDVSLQGRACDKSLFQNNSFLENVFSDNTIDTSLKFPHAKCILEINPAKIDSTNINDFWTGLSGMPCSNMTSDINLKNLDLENQNVVLQQTARTIQDQVDQLEKIHNDKITKNVDLQQQIDKLENNIRSQQTSNALANDKLEEMRAIWKVYDLDCSSRLGSLDTRQSRCIADTHVVEENYNDTNTRYQKLLPQIASNANKMSFLQSTFDNLTIQNSNLQTSIVNNGLLLDDYTFRSNTCRTSALARNLELSDCQFSLQKTVAAIVQANTDYSSCSANLSTCGDNLGSCTTNVNTLTKNRDDILSLYNVCNLSNVKCAASNIAMQNEVNVLRQNYSEWSNTHVKCHDLEIQNAQSILNNVTQSCQMSQADKEQATIVYNTRTAYAQQVSTDCQKNLTTLPTIPAETKTAPGISAPIRSPPQPYIGFSIPVFEIHVFEDKDYGGNEQVFTRNSFPSVENTWPTDGLATFNIFPNNQYTWTDTPKVGVSSIKIYSRYGYFKVRLVQLNGNDGNDWYNERVGWNTRQQNYDSVYSEKFSNALGNANFNYSAGSNAVYPPARGTNNYGDIYFQSWPEIKNVGAGDEHRIQIALDGLDTGTGYDAAICTALAYPPNKVINRDAHFPPPPPPPVPKPGYRNNNINPDYNDNGGCTIM